MFLVSFEYLRPRGTLWLKIEIRNVEDPGVSCLIGDSRRGMD
jgi:hypothetical protein